MVPATAHKLIPIPGTLGQLPDSNNELAGGPGGVLIACENFLVYKRLDHAEIRCSIPIRVD